MRKRLFDNTIKKLEGLTKSWGKADIFLVGGCVRDLILKTGVNNIDILINKKNGAQDFCKWLENNGLAKNCSDSGFVLVVNDSDVTIKSSSLETSLKEDALKRDFCCNALYQNIITKEILDPTENGMVDAKNKILRTPLPADQTFSDNPLTMLRAFRFYTEKNFTILPELYKSMKPYPKYKQLDLEKVRDEFCRIIKSRKASGVIRKLHETGLLEYIIPEFEESWGFNQNSHYHTLNLTDHSLGVLDRIMSGDIRIRIAALLHDISKYKTWTVKHNGEFSYHGHEKESAKMSVLILKRLKFPEEDIQVIQKIIEEHMILKPFRDPVSGKYNGSQKVTRKIVRELGDEMKLCLDLIEADNNCHAPVYNMPDQVSSFYDALIKISKVQIQRSCPVSGDDMMKELGLKPGPVIKEIKDIMLDWLDENPELSKEELLERYKQEYDGSSFWIWEDKNYASGFLGVSFTEPIRDATGNNISPVPYEYPFYIEKGNIELVGWKEQRKSIENPKLFSALSRFKKSRAIFSEAANVLSKLRNIPGFSRVSMFYDDYNDLSGEIDWKDIRTDYIM